ncbi:hypothetical protein HCC61_09580 [Streptomyces sp. HNM0575]|uniref:hypothetical protein n=1 Tax=Streptomyces sp. HNM0575 TaxID=2716338 RepID=UPI00145CCE09|nr:hypothetical protein [Streptomyces sp. HNM0575]NLU72923.1 hypothetical protein [Streptomyces sp. HNM0575]
MRGRPNPTARWGLPRVWGAREDEIRRAYPCDGLIGGPREEWFRAVTVTADRATVFRWLCQLKVAPYSYDLLDNRGRRSPRQLTPGAGRLETGQRVMRIFRLAAFAPDGHMTLIMDDPKGVRLFGDFTVTYSVTDEGPGTTRLLAKLVVGGTDGAMGRLRRPVLAWGDLFMMRRQLLTLRKLAERG